MPALQKDEAKEVFVKPTDTVQWNTAYLDEDCQSF